MTELRPIDEYSQADIDAVYVGLFKEVAKRIGRQPHEITIISSGKRLSLDENHNVIREEL